jgi:hypothetical protein
MNIVHAQNVIYVDKNSTSATENGSSASPFKTIGGAAGATQLQSNTTVIVRGGRNGAEVVYEEANIVPRVSGTANGYIVFRPETYTSQGRTVYENVVIRHSGRRSNGTTITTDAEYSSTGVGDQTDVFNLGSRNYVWIEGFNFKDYKYSRNTIYINGDGNVVINNRFENLGCQPDGKSAWIPGLRSGGIIIPIDGTHNVVRNNYFNSIYGEVLSYNGGARDNIITENTIIGVKRKNESTASTLGGRFEGNRHNVFAFNYNGGSEDGRTVWLDVCVGDFTMLRNIAHNTYCLFFNESGCDRNWAYENIAYNRGLNSSRRMQPASAEMDFPAQAMPAAYYPAIYETGSTWDARWVNNVSYNVKTGFILGPSWRDETRNNIAYEDASNTRPPNDAAPGWELNGWDTDALGFVVNENSLIGYRSRFGYNVRGGGPQVIRNNLWYSTKKANFVRYMEPTQNAISVAELNAQISGSDLAVPPGFVGVNASTGAFDFRLSPTSPARGTGDNGVNRGAYAIYEPGVDYDIQDRGQGLYDVGYNGTLGPIADVHASFAQLNSPGPGTNFLNGTPGSETNHFDPHRPLLKAGDIVNLEVKLNKPATKAMSFKVEPVAGDAWMQGHPRAKFPDFRFPNGQTVTFGVNEQTKTVRIEILKGNPQHKLDQLLALRIQPVAGSTVFQEVGAMNMHLIKIRRVEKYTVTITHADGILGKSVVREYIPNKEGFPTPPQGHHPFSISAKPIPGFTFAGWETGQHEVKVRLADRNSANTTLLDDKLERHVSIRAKWTPNPEANEGTVSPPAVTAISSIPGTLTLTAGATQTLSPTIQPSGRTVHDVIWVSTNPRIATVTVSDDGTVTVTALSSGTATIRGKAVRNHNVVANCVVTVNGTMTTPTPEMRTEGGFYTIRNVDNGRYMEAVGANVEVKQGQDGFSPDTKWRLSQASPNYYYIRIAEGENTALYMSVPNPNNDANIGLEGYTGTDNQQFKFVQVSGDMYLIRTRITNDASCVDAAASGNILQWVSNGGLNQYWIVEFHPDPDVLLTPDSDSYFGTDETNIAAVNGQEAKSLNIVNHPYTDNIFGTWGWNNGGYSWGGDYDYKRTFDGNNGTYFDGPPQGHVGVELKAPYAVKRVVYRPRAANFVNRLNGAKLQGSPDGTSYVDILTLDCSALDTYTKVWEGNQSGGWTANAGKKYKYYRLTANGTAELNISILELYALIDTSGGDVTSVLERDRTVPPIVTEEDAAVIAPVRAVSSEFTFGPNPVMMSSGKAALYRVGNRVNNGTLRIYNANGNFIRKINITDNAAIGTITRRIVGEWDLRDGKGRPVAEGTYLLRGTVKTVDGKRERVSVIIGVR